MGLAPGENEGGVIEFLQHSIEIETSVIHMTDALHMNVNNLHLGGSLNASDLEDMPEGATVVGNADAPIVQCVQPTVQTDTEEEGTVVGHAEPEVIGAKRDEE